MAAETHSPKWNATIAGKCFLRIALLMAGLSLLVALSNAIAEDNSAIENW